MKRCLDVAASFVGLLLLSPLFLLIAAVVKLTSNGPVFFQQERVGRHFTKFHIIKFRTMVPDAPKLGSALTAGRDPRITPIGRFLRATKLDELPQLWNVLRGDMSLVGPRPEVPKYVEMFRDEYRQILVLRPGITDPASLKYRHESELLGEAKDPESVYVNTILPDKISIGKEYVQSHTLAGDLGIILKTLFRMAA